MAIEASYKFTEKHKIKHNTAQNKKTKSADLRLSGQIMSVLWESGQKHKDCAITHNWPTHCLSVSRPMVLRSLDGATQISQIQRETE